MLVDFYTKSLQGSLFRTFWDLILNIQPKRVEHIKSNTLWSNVKRHTADTTLQECVEDNTKCECGGKYEHEKLKVKRLNVGTRMILGV